VHLSLTFTMINFGRSMYFSVTSLFHEIHDSGLPFVISNILILSTTRRGSGANMTSQRLEDKVPIRHIEKVLKNLAPNELRTKLSVHKG